MNFNNGGTSYLPSSTSSSEKEDELADTRLVAIDAEKELIRCMITRNNMVINYLINQQTKQVSHGGSIMGHAVIRHDRETVDLNLFNDYFVENPRYNDVMFRQGFRMSCSLFHHIVHVVKRHDSYFKQRSDGLGQPGLSTLQKITVVFYMLTYGLPVDTIDEYIKIDESIVIESMKRFCRAIVEIFLEQYLRSPTPNDIDRLLYLAQKHGFPIMLGSLDCKHWRWKNCPTAWAEQYAAHSRLPTIIVETVADYDLLIWHA